jgi:hypothetical protein
VYEPRWNKEYAVLDDLKNGFILTLANKKLKELAKKRKSLKYNLPYPCGLRLIVQ